MTRDRKLHIKNVAYNNSNGNYLELFGISGVSSCHAELYSYPMKIAKTRLQINTDGKFVGLFGITQSMIKNEGFFSMYHGLSKTLMSSAIFNGLRLIQYDFLRNLSTINLADGTLKTTFMLSIMNSSLAGGLSEGFICPINKIREHFQIERKAPLDPKQKKVKNWFQTLGGVLKTKGLKGLYCGNSQKTIRSMLLTIGDTTGYDMSKTSILMLTGMPDDTWLQFLSSVSAGILTTMLVAPADIIQTRLLHQAFVESSSGALYKNALDCTMKIFKKEGIFSFYSGFAPLWLRIGPWTIIYWFSIEKARWLLERSPF